MKSPTELPIKMAEFLPLLQDETWCTSYAFYLRWPNGFICHSCQTHHPEIRPQKNPVCRTCGKRSSVTAGTLMHSSKKQLCKWFQAVWWISSDTSSLNIKKMQRQLQLNSYQTAWIWMTKLRLAMQVIIYKKCQGTVLIDSESMLGKVEEGSLAPLLAGVESIADGRTTGRIRMMFCQDSDSTVISHFCDRSFQPGSIIVAPYRDPFISVETTDHIYTLDKGRTFHNTVQKLFSTYHKWYEQKKIRSVSPRSQQDCLDEFCFLQNSTLYPSRLHLFKHLITAVLKHFPAPADTYAGRTDFERGAV